MNVDILKGKTLLAINPTKGEFKDAESLEFVCSDGSRYLMDHIQECCEDVHLEDICGDITDLIGSPLLMAEQVSSDGVPAPSELIESFTWTFYKFATIKGYVTLRWLGESNGYYSEEVDFIEINPSTCGREAEK